MFPFLPIPYMLSSSASFPQYVPLQGSPCSFWIPFVPHVGQAWIGMCICQVGRILVMCLKVCLRFCPWSCVCSRCARGFACVMCFKVCLRICLCRVCSRCVYKVLPVSCVFQGVFKFLQLPVLCVCSGWSRRCPCRRLGFPARPLTGEQNSWVELVKLAPISTTPRCRSTFYRGHWAELSLGRWVQVASRWPQWWRRPQHLA